MTKNSPPGFVLSLALQYLKYLSQNKKLTERALKLKNFKSELVSDIYNQFLEDKLFGKAYHDFKVTGKVNVDEVTSDLKKEEKDKQKCC